MKNKQLPILLAVLAVSGGAAIWKYKQRASAIGEVPAEVGKDVLKDFRAADVAAITLKDSTSEAVIEKKDGKWVVPSRDSFPAAADQVRTLIDEAFGMKIGEMQRAGASQMGTIKLKSPADSAPPEETGTLVSFRDDAGKDIASLIAGKILSASGDSPSEFSMSPQGPKTQYLKLMGMDGFVIKAREGFNSLQTDPKAWLDKTDFIKISSIRNVTVTGAAPEESWQIFRETDGGELKLDTPAEGEEFDPAKAAGVGSAFSFVQFADVLPAADAAKAAMDKPVRTAVITTFDNYTYHVKVGAAEGENYYFSYSVDAKFDETRPPPAPKADGTPSETEEQKKAADEAFVKSLEEKKTKLKAQQANASRIFLVAKSSLEPILKKRKDYMKDKPVEAAAGIPSPPPVNGAAGASTAPKRPPITAVTPPIEVKPLPDGAKSDKTIEAVTPPVSIDPAAIEAAQKAAEAKKAEEVKKAAEEAAKVAAEAVKAVAKAAAEAAPAAVPEVPAAAPEAPAAALEAPAAAPEAPAVPAAEKAPEPLKPE